MFGLNFLHRLLGDVHTPHYFNEIALAGYAADKPSGVNAKDNMLYYEQDTGLWKRYRLAISTWETVITISHGSLTDVHTPHYFDEVALIGLAANKPTGANAKDHMLYFETDTRIWKKYTLSIESWITICTDTRAISFNLGLAILGTKVAQVLIPSNLTISEVIAYADVAPAGADLRINIKINSTSLWDDSDRLIIPAGNYSGSNSNLDHTALAKGDRLSIDIDQVGSTTAGGDDLTVNIICS